MVFARSVFLLLAIGCPIQAFCWLEWGSTSREQSAAQVTITTASLPDAVIDRAYSTTVVTEGGTPPSSWQIVSGKLPPGIKLQEATGLISGTPTEPGTYKFKLMVTDNAGTSDQRDFTIEVLNYLVAEWKSPATLSGNTISGSVEVANYSKDTFDLTVIIVAVNEIGKAFALGYQRLDLPPSGEQLIPFSASVPNGHYIVHADAIAEIPARRQIYRKHMQTNSPITVNVNR